MPNPIRKGNGKKDFYRKNKWVSLEKQMSFYENKMEIRVCDNVSLGKCNGLLCLL